MKNVLVITGSPRKDGNSDLLAKAFMEGVKEAGNEAVLFEAGKMKINGCVACNTCFSKGAACSHDDDFSLLAPMLEKADTVVFCTPLYWFTFPAQIKAAIDKMYSFAFANKKLKIKEAVLMVCAETGDGDDFEGIVKAYNLILNYMGWENRGIMKVPKVNQVGDILKTDWLDAAKKAGLGI